MCLVYCMHCSNSLNKLNHFLAMLLAILFAIFFFRRGSNLFRIYPRLNLCGQLSSMHFWMSGGIDFLNLESFDLLRFFYFQKDQRYLLLEPMPEDRAKMVRQYFDELQKKGTPPPPTATHPSSRYKKE